MPRSGSTTARGYGHAYQKAREALLAGNPVCHWQLEGCTRVATTADHDPPIELVGHPHLNLVPACKHCNSAKGARIVRRRPPGMSNPPPGW